jgi:RecA/RadA recombinase
MAKQNGVFSFNDLNKEMSKNSKWGGLMSDGAGVSEITDYIPVGNYICNACLTGSVFKGAPNNRILCVSGESGTGKTYLLMNMAREAQKKGHYVIWYDSENAIELSQLVQFGVDPEKFRYEPVGTVQDFKTSITQTLDLLIEQKEAGNQIPSILFILDSVGNLATQKEIDDAKAASDKADMTRAKQIRAIFRIVAHKMGIVGATFAFSNHIYMTTDLFAQRVQSGGKGLIYGASIILNLSKARLKEGSDNLQTGIIVTAEPDKNRFCKPVKVKFYISYVNGMNPYVGLEEYISFERCGIQKGKFITEKEYSKSPNPEYIRVEKADGEVVYFVPSETSRNYCLDNGETITPKELFTPKAFTRERLERLDKYIQEEFRYAEGVRVDDLFEDSPGDNGGTVEDQIKAQLIEE